MRLRSGLRIVKRPQPRNPAAHVAAVRGVIVAELRAQRRFFEGDDEDRRGQPQSGDHYQHGDRQPRKGNRFPKQKDAEAGVHRIADPSIEAGDDEAQC